MDETEKRVRRLEDQILTYLQAHPKAADTIDGIAKWWLGGEGSLEALEDVEIAVLRLVERGRMVQTLKPDGESIYHLAQRVK